MSLIADSLKSALKDKSQKSETHPEINLLPRGDVFKESKKTLVLKVVFMIGVPAAILIYLISQGAFDKQGAKLSQLPSLKSFGAKPQQRPQTPPAVPGAAEKKEAAPDKPKLAEKPLPVPQAKPQAGKETPGSAVPTAPPPKPGAGTRSEKPLPVAQAKQVPEEKETPPLKAGPVVEKEIPVSLPAESVQREPLHVPVLQEMRTEMAAPSEKAPKAEPPPAKEKPKAKKTPVKKSRPSKAAKAAPPGEYAEEETARQEAPLSRPEGKTGPARSKAPSPDLPKTSDYYFNRGIFFQQSGDGQKALENYRKAIEINPNNPDIYNNMGVIYKDLGKYDEAIEQFLQAVYYDANYVKAYNNIGVIYYLTKNHQGAISNYEKALEIKPNNLETHNNLAVVYKKMGLNEKAKNILNKALSIDPNHAGTNYNLALLYEEEGAVKSAIHFYRRFIELGETSHASLVAEVREHIEALQ